MTTGATEGAAASGSAPSGAAHETLPIAAPHAATARPYFWMLLAAVAFAGMAAFARTLAPHLDWRLIALVRSGMALVFAVGLVHASGARLVFWRPWTLWMRSLAGSVSMVCTFYALAQKLPLAEVLTISNVFPIWVALLSWPLLGEIPGLSVWLAIVVGLSGVVVLERPQSLAGTSAAAVVLLGSVFTAIAMLGLHRLQHLSARAVVAHFSGVAMLTCGTLVLCNLPTVAARSQFSVSVVCLLLGLGVCATVGQIFLTKAFAAGPPAKVSVVALTQVAFALALDMVFWRHRFDGWDLAGIALVVAPTIWLLVSRPAIAGPRPDID